MTTLTATKKRTSKSTKPVTQTTETVDNIHGLEATNLVDNINEVEDEAADELADDEMTDTARAKLEAVLVQVAYVKTAFRSSKRQLAFILRWADRFERDLTPQLLVEVRSSITEFQATLSDEHWFQINNSLDNLADALEAQLDG